MVAISTSTVVMQFIAFFMNILVAIVGVAIPYIFKNNNLSTMILSFLNSFAGGVLLSVSMTHILPEIGENLNEAAGGFQVSYCITFLGTFLIVFLKRMGLDDHGHEHADNSYDVSE